MANFKMVSPFKAAGDQVKAIENIAKSFGEGKNKITLVGVTGSGKTFTMAEVITRVKKPTLILSHNKTLAAQLFREFKEFFPENAVEYFVSYYDYYQPEAYVPSSDTFIEKDMSMNEEIDKLRLRATSSLLERDDVIIVSSVSCIYGLGSPEDYMNSVVMLQVGDKIDRDQIIRKFLHIQYARNDIDFSRGNFRVRGDTIEIMPSYQEEGIRIELFGDEIDGLSKIDPLTGKVKIKLDRVVVYPAKHFITSGPKIKDAMEKIKEEMAAQKEYFLKQGKHLEAERIESRTNYDMEMLLELGYCSGIENYSRHLTGRAEGERPACLLDYFPGKDFLLIIDESHVTLPQIGGMYAGDRSRKQTLVEFGFRLPSALDNRPLNFTEFEAMTPRTLYVSATPDQNELNKSEAVFEQIIRPTGLLDPVVEVRPTTNQIEDLLNEIRLRINQKERVLITTLTKKMSEDLTDYYKEVGLKIAYLHSEIDTIERTEIIRDLRKGVYDCIVGINLLREGLDIPEVSLVAILDADKEGFLRNYKSLVQTIGRAARNVNGKAILYADRMTDSIKKAMSETERRRLIQEAHNEKMGITPQTIQKEIHDILPREMAEEDSKEEALKDLEKEFTLKKYKTKDKLREALKREMLRYANDMDFEKAAMFRDKMLALGPDKIET
ncbi:Helicase subunit of the DNA excision repair complex [Leptospira biflexa serovar Patoc strain 'Patoc 1 (Ames)']|uniref:UvrABC system protein B n=2 Tax=Leptospira biflexa serovar Patoc TaxID=145259 RepID=UVRB_LEPBP|nr:excinuclease ABC subunit UvrB [Leptospira biflexa]B0SDE2.1 RecName: Full=UvrABC system protein B; Short=Protein UvrB; AltName: Full=Excinuclease ABC subunit B [Leptospira biflexa serovar Patoc strain 'Patoc 1 (Ames)']B0SLS0.1 RecName: Full=UvrABC system protein B; Short=Protein UvrB; AltName: Full=Excinuclease ABC subunit B [Leptospira biflexa serovar Patoc strain 'Patoc 1 (Paris)']ABZ93347.1 Helicase subunit of the DNA excision repair complex [Leptospira biflexa serovar Patoc strain 'Patoc 1